ncbi:MAG: class I SAM-dependent methyltransferase [Planctomycetota bacterium]
MKALRFLRAVVGTILVLASGCAGPREPAEPAAASSSPEPRSVVAAPNRDHHGDHDVARYIERLQSEDRVADLQVDLVVEKLALPADAVIGDLGCGPGLFAVAFARACPQGLVYASDIEPAQLDRVRERIRAHALGNIVPVLASADDPHFPRARLDLVFVADTYHHLQDRVAYFERLRSVLVPDSRLVVLEYKPGKIPVGPPPDHKLPAGVMQAELEQAGYVLVEKFDTHLWHDFEVWRVGKPAKSGR